MFSKDIEKIIKAVLKEYVQNENKPYYAARIDSVQPRDRYTLHTAGVNIDINAATVTQNGAPVAKLEFVYSDKKVNLCYKLLRVNLIYL